MSIYSIAGVSVPVDSNVIGQVEEGSIAAKAGIEAGDTILSVDGVSCSSWMDVYDAIGKAAGQDDIAIEYQRDGKKLSTSVALKEDERLGVYASTQVVHLDPITSARLSFSYVQQTAEGVMRLLQPQHTMEILDQSSSIVGISVMSSQAAAAGPATFLTFAALISFSLGFMNLLPIPPLDGGKLVIEIIQKVAGRELPLKVQTIVSYVASCSLRCCLSICFVPTSFDLFCRGVFGLSLSHPLPRELTRPVHVGGVQIGGGAPVVVQSMTCTDTADARQRLRKCVRLPRRVVMLCA